MAAALTASFVLKLEDKLSSGIVALTKKLEALSALAGKLKFDGLQQAGNAMDKVGGAADRVSAKVDGIGRSARSAMAELKRLSSQPIMVNARGTAFLPPSVTRAAMAATIAAAAATGGGGYRPPALGHDASFEAGPQLRLAGPGGGGIPLQFSPALMQVATLRAGLAAAAGHARQINHHLREAGHGALGALTTGFGLFEPVREYAAYENVLRHIAITENTPREQLPTVIAGMTKAYNQLALSTGQSAEKVAESANFLITTGIGGKAVDAMLPVIAKAATAYNTNIGDSVQAVFALKENLHVPDAQLGTAVSSGALAAKEGHFNFQDMSRYLPAVAPIAAMSGLKGLGGAQELMASLETSRRNSGTSEEAFTNYRDYLSHLFGDPKRGLAHTFKKGFGVNLEQVLLNAEKQGISAPEAVIAQVKQLVKGKTAYETNLIIGRLFHNQQSASYVRGRLADDDYFKHTRDKLSGTDPDTIQNDFLKAFDAPQVQLNRLQEALKQIVRRFGEGFAGLVPPITAGLQAVLWVLDKLDAKFPGLGNKVLVFTGGFLALMAVLGVLSPVIGAIGSGFALVAGIISGPFLGVLAAVAGAAYLIYRNWDFLGPYFQALWQFIQKTSEAFWAWMNSWTAGDVQQLVENFKAAWDGLKEWFSALWAGIVGTFSGLIDGIERRIAEVKSFLGLGGATGGPSPNDAGGAGDHPTTPAPSLKDPLSSYFNPAAYRPSGAGAGAGGQVGFAPLEIKVTVDGNAKVEAPKQVQPINRGPMLGYT